MLDRNVVLWNLKRYGSPLAWYGHPTQKLSLEETLAHGLALSRTEPSVAEAWPVVFVKHRSEVDLDALAAMASQLGQTQTLGFFMGLLGELLQDSSLEALEEKLGRGQSWKMRYFFDLGQGPLYLELTRMKTPEVAKRWGFWMNTTLEDFRSALRKFAPTHATVS
jgi:hypothetical protein